MNFRNLIPSYRAKLNSNYTYTFTVFTPTYNAELTIERTHKSLVNQTFKDFEWLIINDGSTDKTHEIITTLIESSSLKINYIHKIKNQHKMACFMEAVNIAQGKFLLTLDADDECVPEALMIFKDEYLSIPKKLKSKVSSITGLCIDQSGNKIGKCFPSDPYYSNSFKKQAIDKISGEKWGFTKTDILRGIVYEEDFVKSGFMQEGIIWNLLARERFMTKYINKVVRIYHLDVKNSISSAPKSSTALGTVIHNVVNLNWFFKDYFLKSPVAFLKYLYFLLKNSIYLDFNLKNYLAALDSNVVKFFLILLWPFRGLFK